MAWCWDAEAYDCKQFIRHHEQKERQGSGEGQTVGKNNYEVKSFHRAPVRLSGQVQKLWNPLLVLNGFKLTIEVGANLYNSLA